jgi:hypothetical protein
MEKKERYRWHGSDRERRKEAKGEGTVIKMEEKDVVSFMLRSSLFLRIYTESVITVIKEIRKDLIGTGLNVTDVLFRHLVGVSVEKSRKR